MNLTQIAGIIRYEIVMAVRRRTPIILLLLMMVGLIAFSLIARDSTERSGIFAEGMPVQINGLDVRVYAPTSSLFTALVATVVIGVIGVVFFTNEVIPLDRQYRMTEVLAATPMSRATYLAGKLAGVWVTLLAIAGLVGGIGLIAAAILLPGYDVRLFLAVWIVFGVPMLLMASALAVLLTSWAGSRRAAILLALLVMPIAVILLSIGLLSLGAVVVFVEPAYGFFLLPPPGADIVALTRERIAGGLPVVIGVPALAWLLAWGWARLREAR